MKDRGGMSRIQAPSAKCRVFARSLFSPVVEVGLILGVLAPIGRLSAAATRPEAERSSALHCPAGAESRPARKAADQQNRCAADAIGRDMKFEISRGTGGSFLVVTAPASRTSIIVETPRESAILAGRKPRGSR